MDPVAIITTATTDLGADLAGVAAPALVIGVGLFALTKGWGLVRRFVS